MCTCVCVCVCVCACVHVYVDANASDGSVQATVAAVCRKEVMLHCVALCCIVLQCVFEFVLQCDVACVRAIVVTNCCRQVYRNVL